MNRHLIEFLKEEESYLSSFIDLIPVPIFVKSIDGLYINCNSAFENLLHVPRNQIIGKSVFDLWENELAQKYRLKDQELFESPNHVQVYENQVKGDDGSLKVVQFYKSTFNDQQGQVAGLLEVTFDLTTQRVLEDQLRQQAQVDYLTTLMNRREGIKQSGIALAQSKRQKQPCSVAMFDIDYFKQINDMLGHDSGDKVLISIKEICTPILREYDLIYRYGGDEFILCLPNTHTDDAISIAERVRESFLKKQAPLLSKHALKIGLSIGIAGYPQDGVTIDELIQASDQALYQAKQNGRNQTQRYSNS